MLFSYLENWTPTIETSKEVIEILIRNLQTFQTKLQQKSINEGFKNEPFEHILELKNRENNQEVDSKSRTNFIGNTKEFPQNTDKGFERSKIINDLVILLNKPVWNRSIHLF